MRGVHSTPDGSMSGNDWVAELGDALTCTVDMESPE